MCLECGCGLPYAPGARARRKESAAPAPSQETILAVHESLLGANDEVAAQNRALFRQHNILAINLMSSPGTGKTFLLETLIPLLPLRCGVVVGDLETDNDARRIARTGAKAIQITTGQACHLDASMVAGALPEFDLANLDVLFIENVGNLVCPSSYDLGERIRVALLSVTEGEDKPLKYPTLFNSADAAVITKIDIAEPCGFDRDTALRNINEIRPGIRIFETSAKTGAGMAEWLGYLAEARNQPK